MQSLTDINTSLNISSIIYELAHVCPIDLLSNLNSAKDSYIRYQHILGMNPYDRVLDYMAKTIYRSLKNERSTKALVTNQTEEEHKY